MSGSNRHERHFNFHLHSMRATTNTPPLFIKFHLHTRRQITRAIWQICISKHYPNSISLDANTAFKLDARSEWIFCLEAKRHANLIRGIIPVSNIVTKFYTSPSSLLYIIHTFHSPNSVSDPWTSSFFTGCLASCTSVQLITIRPTNTPFSWSTSRKRVIATDTWRFFLFLFFCSVVFIASLRQSRFCSRKGFGMYKCLCVKHTFEWR